MKLIISENINISMNELIYKQTNKSNLRLLGIPVEVQGLGHTDRGRSPHDGPSRAARVL